MSADEITIAPGGVLQAPEPVPADQRARERISALVLELMMRDGIMPHVIAGALVANLTVTICSSAPSLAEANRGLNAAAEALKANKRFAPTLLAQAAQTRHAVENLPQGGRQ